MCGGDHMFYACPPNPTREMLNQDSVCHPRLRMLESFLCPSLTQLCSEDLLTQSLPTTIARISTAVNYVMIFPLSPLPDPWQGLLCPQPP